MFGQLAYLCCDKNNYFQELQYVLFILDIAEFIERCKHAFAGFWTGLDFFYSLESFEFLYIASALEAPLSSDSYLYLDYSEHTLDFAINFDLLYYVLSSICIRLDKLPVAIIFFVLNYIAYVAVILPWRN